MKKIVEILKPYNPEDFYGFPPPPEKRYIIVDDETGAVVDDAQGYGYKSELNARRAMEAREHYNANKEKFIAEKSTIKQIKKWRGLRKIENEVAVMAMDAMKDGRKFKVTDKIIERIVKENGIECPYEFGLIRKAL